jgi:iron(III) transport system ATP-binding protein
VAAVSVKAVTKRFGSMTAVDNVELDIQEGQFVTLVGPSGCGKTTLLRMIAGLETPTEGDIEILGDTVFSTERKRNVPPHARRLSMVFQSYALWPHMTAFDNVAFPLRRAHGRRRPGRAARAEIHDQVMQALGTVHCEALARRHPGEMSGGQQQRVALARAIVGSPRLVLMDEPLSNLDAKLRARLRFELRAIQQELGFTALYVTHDRAEALSMSDVVVVLRDGRIEQFGEPHQVYHRPTSSYVSDFLGDHNLISGQVVGSNATGVEVETALGRSTSAVPPGGLPTVGQPVIASVARGAVIIETAAAADPPAAPAARGADTEAVVLGVGYHGWFSEVLLRLDSGEEVTARVEGRSGLEVGAQVRARITGIASVEAVGEAPGGPLAGRPEIANGQPTATEAMA